MKGTVFARMSPDQKLQLIEELQNIGYIYRNCTEPIKGTLSDGSVYYNLLYN